MKGQWPGFPGSIALRCVALIVCYALTIRHCTYTHTYSRVKRTVDRQTDVRTLAGMT